MESIRVGVIGTGRMGINHCRIYATLRGVEFAGVCDLDPEVGIRAAERYDTRFYSEVDELLGCVDAVSIATPTPTHYELAIRCLERGIHVLVEKPLAENLRQAEDLVAATEANSVVFQVGHIERFNPAYRELKEILDDMTVLAIEFRRLSAFGGSNTDTDTIYDLMIHDADLVLNLMGQEPSKVTAHGLTALSGEIDHAIAQLRFDFGPLVVLTASRVTEHKIRMITVTTVDAYLETDLLNKSITIHRRTMGEFLNHNRAGVKYRQESIVERISIPIFEPLYLQLQSFIESITKGKPAPVSVVDGFQALRLVERIRNSLGEPLHSATELFPIL